MCLVGALKGRSGGASFIHIFAKGNYGMKEILIAKGMEIDRIMNKFVNLTGKQFGRLTVTGFEEYRKRPDGRNNGYWRCICRCGHESIVSTANLTSGAVQSCGCLMLEKAKETHTVHGFCSRKDKTPRLYSIWGCMKTRCYNKNREDYKYYGGRGISVCNEWKHNFAAFREWALSNGYDDSLTLDRIDPDGNYCPSNCRWATAKEQGNNKRRTIFLEIDGVRKTLTQWADDVGMPRNRIYSRYYRGDRGHDLIRPVAS